MTGRGELTPGRAGIVRGEPAPGRAGTVRREPAPGRAGSGREKPGACRTKTVISSVRNDQVKAVAELQKKAKARKEQGLFVAEGRRMVFETPGPLLSRLYLSETFVRDPKNRDFLSAFPEHETVTDQVFAAMSDTRTPQGVLAVVKMPRYELEDLLGNGRPAHLLVLENLQDPGNLGTILRSGEGAGVTGVLMSRDTVDIFNPKVIRSTMGSVYRVPFLYVDELESAVRELKARGIRLFAAHLEGRRNYEEEDYTGDIGFLIGNEGNGLSEELSAAADGKIRIPMAGQVESLNAAVAAAVLTFEAARQRRR